MKLELLNVIASADRTREQFANMPSMVTSLPLTFYTSLCLLLNVNILAVSRRVYGKPFRYRVDGPVNHNCPSAANSSTFNLPVLKSFHWTRGLNKSSWTLAFTPSCFVFPSRAISKPCSSLFMFRWTLYFSRASAALSELLRVPCRLRDTDWPKAQVSHQSQLGPAI